MDIRSITALTGKITEQATKPSGKKAESSPQTAPEADRVELSAEAKSMGKMKELVETANASSAVRAEKVAEIKAKIANGEIPSLTSDRQSAEAIIKGLK